MALHPRTRGRPQWNVEEFENAGKEEAPEGMKEIGEVRLLVDGKLRRLALLELGLYQFKEI